MRNRCDRTSCLCGRHTLEFCTSPLSPGTVLVRCLCCGWETLAGSHETHWYSDEVVREVVVPDLSYVSNASGLIGLLHTSVPPRLEMQERSALTRH